MTLPSHVRRLLDHVARGRHHGRAVLGLVVGVQGAALSHVLHVRGDLVVRRPRGLVVEAAPRARARVALVVKPRARILGPAVGWRHSLLLLPPVAEPHSNHLLLQLEAVGEAGDLLCGGLWVLIEMLFQSAFYTDLYGGPFLAFAALRRDLVNGGRGAGRRVGLRQPLLE